MTARGAGGVYAFVRLRSGLVLDRASPCELDNGRLVFGSAFFQFSALRNVRGFREIVEAAIPECTLECECGLWDALSLRRIVPGLPTHGALSQFGLFFVWGLLFAVRCKPMSVCVAGAQRVYMATARDHTTATGREE